MEKKLSQEGLKLIACLTMLLDHFGAIVVVGMYRSHPAAFLVDVYNVLRLVGRLAFPIYCFLLAEGSFHTRNPLRYGLRLAVCAVLSELPYDFALHGGMDWGHQNVMVTLLVGFCALEMMKKCPNPVLKVLAALPFVVAGMYTHADYGYKGVALVILFGLTRDMPFRWLLQALGMWFIFSPGHRMALNWIAGISVTRQELAVLALVPIFFYSGEKRTNNKAVQWGFYLFYPVHLLILMLLG